MMVEQVGNLISYYQSIVKLPPGYMDVQSIFTVPVRYINLEYLNRGAQGIVVRAYDSILCKSVAIKKLDRIFTRTEDARRAYREFVLITTFRHRNVIQLLNAFTPASFLDDFHEFYIVMEYVDWNLNEVIHGDQRPFEHTAISNVVYQILCAVKHFHDSDVIHRDLKPENMVVRIDNDAVLKILDFGLARRPDQDHPLTGYVVTRYYRAPEVILGVGYNEKVDVWSVGCIMAEMITGRILFQGLDHLDQFHKIRDVLGHPNDNFMSRLEPNLAGYLMTLPPVTPATMEDILPSWNFMEDPANPHYSPEMARDLLSSMLRIDPNERCSVLEALNHPYLQSHWRQEDMNVPPSPNHYNPAIDTDDVTLFQWKERIFQEVKAYEASRNIYMN